MLKKDYNTLKKKVLHVLEMFPETRNSDIELTIQIWKTFYPDRLTRNLKSGELSGITFRTLFDLPREDNVKRARAQVQNVDGLFPPTNWKVAKKRGFNEIDWKRSLGYCVYDQTGQASILV